MDFKAKAASTDKKGWTAFPLNQPLTALQSTQIQWQCYQSSCYYQRDLSYDVFFFQFWYLLGARQSALVMPWHTTLMDGASMKGLEIVNYLT